MIQVHDAVMCYRYYSDRGVCAKCYLSCMTCSGPRRDQCVTCPRGWQLAAGECHPECPEGFFKSNYGCQKCHHYCRTCSGKHSITCLLNYLLTYLLTPRSTVLHEKLTGFQLVKKFPAFYGTQRFITTFTTAPHLSLS